MRTTFASMCRVYITNRFQIVDICVGNTDLFQLCLYSFAETGPPESPCLGKLCRPNCKVIMGHTLRAQTGPNAAVNILEKEIIAIYSLRIALNLRFDLLLPFHIRVSEAEQREQFAKLFRLDFLAMGILLSAVCHRLK